MRTFEITHNGKTYTLGMTRAILRELEEKNHLTLLNNDDILNKTYVLFYGAVKYSNPTIKFVEAVNLLDEITAVDENGECEYDFTNIATAVSKLATNCMETGNAKNVIQID